MNINWFPGHMKKALDQIQAQMGQVDLSLEIVDGRIPEASRNLLLEEVTQGKPRLLILNKKDLADASVTRDWVAYYQKSGGAALALEARAGANPRMIYDQAQRLCQDTLLRRQKKGIRDRTLRMMVFGIPNSGKSTLINRLAGRKAAQTGDRPGVTRANQWIKTTSDLLLLDTPGIMMKKLTPRQGLYLSWTGAIKEEILNLQEVGYALLQLLLVHYEPALIERYQLPPGLDALGAMDVIAQKIGALEQGEIAYDRVAIRLLDDFQKGRLGRISLERVEELHEAGSLD